MALLTRVGKYSPREYFLCRLSLWRKYYMLSANMFSFNGYGYLKNIIYDEDKYIAKINAIDESLSDDIWLECEIQGLIQEQLFNLLNEVKKGHSVIVTFNAAYRRFMSAICCIDPSDPEHILILRCKLLSLRACYVDGIPVDKICFSFKIAA
jgi:hypothetical protein